MRQPNVLLHAVVLISSFGAPCFGCLANLTYENFTFTTTTSYTKWFVNSTLNTTLSNFTAAELIAGTESTTTTEPTTTTRQILPFCDRFAECRNFADVVNEIPELLPCQPYFNDTFCVNENGLVRFDKEAKEHAEALHEILFELEERNCDCLNRSVEMFCHFLLPECTEIQTKKCGKGECSKVHFSFPCPDYCHNVTKS